MKNRIDLEVYKISLLQEEKSKITIEKYASDGAAFLAFAGEREITKELCLAYKQTLMEHYAPRSVNSKIASLNSLLAFLGKPECRVKALRLQREIYTPAEKELTREEYMRLLDAAKKCSRLAMMIETICATGIRVSELSYFTVEAVRTGTITVRCKNKIRNIFVPGKLKSKLLKYANRCGIKSGLLFCTRSGKPVSRSNIWAEMKRLCAAARVNPQKVFPHNLRKLFARTFYRMEKDIAKLADLLGHSSINTTRIYIMTTGSEHRRKLESLGLIL